MLAMPCAPRRQDKEADDRRQDRSPDEDLGEAHFDASAVVALAGLTLLSTATWLPFDSLFLTGGHDLHAGRDAPW